MRLVNASFEICEQQSKDFWSHIENVARTCYKSTPKEGQTSKEWVEKVLLSKRHLAMCEHGTVYLVTDNPEVICFYSGNKFSVVNILKDIAYITTNLRVLLDNERMEDLKYQTEYIKDYHERRISVKFVIDRGVSHEFVRNRGSEGTGFGQESTRYVDYFSNKNGNVCTFIQAPFIKEEDQKEYEEDLQKIEDLYFKWRGKGYKPQEARGFLCNFTKTELWITATAYDWGHFFFLRADKAAHPQAQEVAYPLKDEFIKRGFLTENDIHY